MNIRNFEFKARVDDLAPYETRLQSLKPDFRGTDHQTDTYFKVKSGRLKLREGNIENALIRYERENTPSSKQSDVILYRHAPDQALKNILIKELGVRTVVSKIRRIYFVDNVKFHFDLVENLGTFIEVEVIDEKDQYTSEQLKEQCDWYFNFFNLKKEQLVDRSYCDLIDALKS
jgi:adenylate cyclase, class 2